MLKLAAALLIMAAFAVAPAAAKQVSFDPNDMGQVVFTLPSGNIGCTYTPEGGTDVYQPRDGGPELICERVEPHYVTVILGPKGDPEVIEDPGEQACCGADNTLEYGDFVVFDSFVCSAATTGLECFRKDGQTFSMARAGIEVYMSDEGMSDEDMDDSGGDKSPGDEDGEDGEEDD